MGEGDNWKLFRLASSLRPRQDGQLHKQFNTLQHSLPLCVIIYERLRPYLRV